ncbi:Uncharacterized protein MCHI_000580 [Candidatus Magnetoovum chiemensis]|nr:Uncharacterized protein MCHI_000580 [Candidatus Magnetoovum chiemensis]
MEIVTSYQAQVECNKCGECCVKGSPTLHISDAQLLKEGTLTYNDIFTIRIGELVYNNIEDEFITIDYEVIKVKEKPNSRTCIFLDENSKICTIYDKKPMQCSAFECWNPQRFMDMYSQEKLTREHLLINNKTLMDIVNTHDERCSYDKLTRIVLQIREGKDLVNDVFEIINYDKRIRDIIAEKLGVPVDYIPVLFGRPVVDTIIMYGYKAEEDKDGNLNLTMV